jgi:hypothetical protein
MSKRALGRVFFGLKKPIEKSVEAYANTYRVIAELLKSKF